MAKRDRGVWGLKKIYELNQTTGWMGIAVNIGVLETCRVGGVDSV